MPKIRRLFKRIWRNNKGAVAVEAAIVIPILLVLTLAIVDFGRYYFTGITMKQATAEAARAVALRQTPTYVATVIDTSLGGVPQMSMADMSAVASAPYIVYCPISSTTTNMAKVEIQLEFVWLTPLGFLAGAATSGWTGANTIITISSEAVCAS